MDAPPRVTENAQNGNFDNNQVSNEIPTIEEVTPPPQTRNRKDISPEAAAVEQRRRESQRLLDIDAEMQTLAPFINEDRDIHLRFLDLQEESLKIHQARGTLHIEGISPFIAIKIDRLILKATTDGKIPVSIGEEIAALYAENGLHPLAHRIRVLTQRAMENGDEFYKQEHMENTK